MIVYDDIPELEIFEVSLTTVGPSIVKLAVLALDILTGEAKPEEGTRWIKKVAEAELIVRESTRVVPS
jgi:DNA-binding LacI/PurR family transcriptional regulator